MAEDSRQFNSPEDFLHGLKDGYGGVKIFVFVTHTSCCNSNLYPLTVERENAENCFSILASLRLQCKVDWSWAESDMIPFSYFPRECSPHTANGTAHIKMERKASACYDCGYRFLSARMNTYATVCKHCANFSRHSCPRRSPSYYIANFVSELLS